MADLTAALTKLIFLFNLILLCLGIFIAYQGFQSNDVVPRSNQSVDEIETLVSSFSTVSKILIFTGVVLAVVSFFGCFGAFFESPPFLTWYIFLMILLIILQICIGYYVYQFKGIDKNKAQDIFWGAMKKYQSDNRYKTFVDGVQSYLRCCGARGVDDWTSLTKTPPPSCCHSNKDPCEVSQSYKKDCASAISELQRDFQSQQVWYIFAIIGFQVVLVMFTFYARKQMVERQELLFY